MYGGLNALAQLMVYFDTDSIIKVSPFDAQIIEPFLSVGEKEILTPNDNRESFILFVFVIIEGSCMSKIQSNVF